MIDIGHVGLSAASYTTSPACQHHTCSTIEADLSITRDQAEQTGCRLTVLMTCMTHDGVVMQPGSGYTSMCVVSRTGALCLHQCLYFWWPYFWWPHQLLASHVGPVVPLAVSAVMVSYCSEHGYMVVLNSPLPPLLQLTSVPSYRGASPNFLPQTSQAASRMSHSM